MFSFIIIIVFGIFTGVKWRKVKKNFPDEMFPEGEGQEDIPTTYIKRKKYLLEIIQFLLIQFLIQFLPFKGLQKCVFKDSTNILTILTSINNFFIPVLLQTCRRLYIVLKLFRKFPPLSCLCTFFVVSECISHDMRKRASIVFIFINKRAHDKKLLLIYENENCFLKRN